MVLLRHENFKIGIQFIEIHLFISVPGLLLRHVEVHGEAAHLVLPLTHDPAEEKGNYV